MTQQSKNYIVKFYSKNGDEPVHEISLTGATASVAEIKEHFYGFMRIFIRQAERLSVVEA